MVELIAYYQWNILKMLQLACLFPEIKSPLLNESVQIIKPAKSFIYLVTESSFICIV